jgi:hypothetical protein
MAHMLLACVTGPNKKHVEQMERMLPRVYMMANGAGFPCSSCSRLNTQDKTMRRGNTERRV